MPPAASGTEATPLAVYPPNMLRQHVFSIAFALCFLVFLLYLAGRGRLNLRYCLLWFGMGAIAFLLAVNQRLLYLFARSAGIGIPVNALFFVGFFLVALQLVQLTVSITHLEEQNKTLCQEIAILRADLETAHAEPQSRARC